MSATTIKEWESDVRSMAAEFADSDQDPSDYAFECADGCQWAIYYSHAWDLVSAMRTHDRAALDAAEGDYGDVFTDEGDTSLDTHMCRLAYLMTHAALWDALEESNKSAA